MLCLSRRSFLVWSFKSGATATTRTRLLAQKLSVRQRLFHRALSFDQVLSFVGFEGSVLPVLLDLFEQLQLTAGPVHFRFWSEEMSFVLRKL
jgi:hypothetical protein